MYKKIDKKIIELLSGIVEKENVVTSEEERENYARDENPSLYALPEAVVKPASREEVAELLKLANAENFPVTARAGGTGVTGGSLAVEGGAVISLERMDKIREIDPDNLMAVVEPGVVTGRLHQAVEEKGLFYPPDPASLENCRLGGNLAEDAGGPRAVKYGVTRDYVTGIEAVLPSGELIEYGGKLAKNATGYNLLHLLIGSEGTLGVITEATVRLLPQPALRVDLLVSFPSYEAAVRCVAALIRKRLTPAAIEFMDRKCLEISRQVLEDGIAAADAAAHLLLEVDGDEEEAVTQQYETIGEVCLESGAGDVMVADTAPTQEKIWSTRRKLRDSLRAVSPIIVGQDVVVPRMAIADFLEKLDGIAGKTGIEIVSFGHAGDGNVHVNFLKREMEESAWKRALEAATREVFSLAIKLGGTISGEHGIGLVKKNYLSLALNPATIGALRRIKEALDPNNILNPGKIFTE